MLCFAGRNSREILRDPLNLAFGLGFPLILLLLLTAIQAHVPVPLFNLDQLTPGIAVFGLSFVSLFSATLIAKDRSSSLMTRLFASPLTSADFIAGYTLPLVPMALAQSAVCFAAAVVLGLDYSANLFLALLSSSPPRSCSLVSACSAEASSMTNRSAVSAAHC
jgi:ABC-2 type transport system permease protein